MLAYAIAEFKNNNDTYSYLILIMIPDLLSISTVSERNVNIYYAENIETFLSFLKYSNIEFKRDTSEEFV